MAKIQIKGTIVSDSDKMIYEWFGIDATSPKDVAKVLELQNGIDVDVDINSGGGDLYAGSEIYTMLKNHKATVRVNITGIAGSAASIIAMAGDIISMSPTAQMMIHNVWSYAEGDHNDFAKEAEILKSHNESVANAYILKTGKSKDELLALMDKETWMNAREAKEQGFIDEIMFDKDKKIAASLQNSLLPESVINKVREIMMNKEYENKLESVSTDVISDNIDGMKMKLNLLKLMEVKS